jgi:RNA polymerase sigma-70 factor (ECF subfamily)
MQAVTDEQLIAWVAGGDASCLGSLFERHNKAVYQYCLQMIRHRQQAEDLTQEVFLKILGKAKSFRGSGSYKGWMFNIARNVTLDYMRSAKRRGTSTSLDEVTEPMLENRSPEQTVAGRQSMSVLAKALASLPASVQETIWLGRFEVDSYEELGIALGCKAGTARVRMHRAMQQLNAVYASINGAPIDV